MKITLSFVASADGRVTGPNGEQSREWASSEDQSFFGTLVERVDVVIMGRNTYEEHKQFFLASPDKRRIVMTSKNLIAPPGTRIEFTNLPPAELTHKLEKERVEKILLAGGPRLSAAFLKARLVNELLLTIEPKVFGGGLPVLDGDIGSPQLSLTSFERIGPETVLLRYHVTYQV